MRVVAMMNWITAYQDTCFRTLHELGDDVLLIHPASYEHAPFDRSRFTTSIERARSITTNAAWPSLR